MNGTTEVVAKQDNKVRFRPGNTFSTIDLRAVETANMEFRPFVKKLLHELKAMKTDRSRFYEALRSGGSNWANRSRNFLAFLRAIAILLTALASALRYSGMTSNLVSGIDDDKTVLIAVLVIYAVMGAVTFYEKGTDKTTIVFPPCRCHVDDR